MAGDKISSEGVERQRDLIKAGVRKLAIQGFMVSQDIAGDALGS